MQVVGHNYLTLNIERMVQNCSQETAHCFTLKLPLAISMFVRDPELLLS